MSGDRQRRVDGSTARQRDDRLHRRESGHRVHAPWPVRSRPATGSRRGLVVFALALVMALAAVLTLIAAGSVQALPHTAALHAKADGWVGLAATVSVLVSAAAGVVLVQRYFISRRR